MWLDKYRIIRRLVMFWACWLITTTCDHYFDNIGKIQLADATVITGIIGILSIVIGYQKIDSESS